MVNTIANTIATASEQLLFCLFVLFVLYQLGKVCLIYIY